MSNRNSNNNNNNLDNLDLLSDDELSLRLVQYGFQNLPVTSTTRKVLIKKLRTYMDNEKQKLRSETSYATSYSSGEESDNDIRAKVTTNPSTGTTNSKSNRVTVSGIVPPQTMTNIYKHNMPPPSLSTTSRISKSSGIGASSALANHQQTQQQNRASSSMMNNNKNSVYISPVMINNDSDSDDIDYANLKSSDKSNNNFAMSSPTSNLKSLHQRYTTIGGNQSIGSGLGVSDKRYSASPQLPSNSFTINSSDSANSSSNGSATNSLDSPFVSECTKRLLQLRDETVNNENNHNKNNLRNRSSLLSSMNNHHQHHYPYQASQQQQQQQQQYQYQQQQLKMNENDIVTHAEPSPEPPHIPLHVACSNLINKLDEYYGFKQTFIPCILLCLFISFLVFIAFIYLTMSPNITSTLVSIDTKYDLCTQDYEPGHCIDESDIQPALNLLKMIAVELQNRVEQHHCYDKSISGVMTVDEMLKFAIEKYETSQVWQILRELHNMEYLIDKNPQWKINHVDMDGNQIDFDEVMNRRATKTNCLTILQPKLPLTCLIVNKLRTFSLMIGCLAILLIVTYLGQMFISFCVYVKRSRKEQVNNLITEITSAVMQQSIEAAAADASAGDSPASAAVIVNHLRDRLMSPLKRKQLEWAWIAAMKFLEQNESRIQFEIGNHGGEDFKMMRWIDTLPTSQHNSPPMNRSPGTGAAGSGSTKKWQSPAFDKTNKINDPPTPCLKIRQMFDKYEINDPNLKTIVSDAILEKVGGKCKIFDIQLDRNTCCVYVRCATNEDAGMIHDEMNGWWFDNRLVSMKFLRLERYLNRFPHSQAGVCLKLSNTLNSSLTSAQQQQLNQNQNKANHSGSKLLNNRNTMAAAAILTNGEDDDDNYYNGDDDDGREED
uniref:Putative man1 n=1 Tax=Corethrella appendiculata TaxID=1370023 RepID=U5EPU7_9DIPT